MKKYTLESFVEECDNSQLTILCHRVLWRKCKSLLSETRIELNDLENVVYRLSSSEYNPFLHLRTYSDFLKYEKSKYHGGCNDSLNTRQEYIFMHFFPALKRQVSFGTGKGGYKVFGTKRYIADFVDEKGKVIIEIDGANHSSREKSTKDKIRDLFFATKGYETIRFTNQEIENLYMITVKMDLNDISVL